jgi:hypothetical protein
MSIKQGTITEGLWHMTVIRRKWIPYIQPYNSFARNCPIINTDKESGKAISKMGPWSPIGLREVETPTFS